MTVYLFKNLFKPALIILSIVFGLVLTLFLILMIAFFHVALLIVFLGLAVAYGVLIYLAFLLSRSTKYYLQETDAYLEIRYPSINYERGLLRLPYKAIVEFQYYPLKSKNSWLNLVQYGAIPGCVYITYITAHGQRLTELMGYIDQNDAQMLAERYGVDLQVM